MRSLVARASSKWRSACARFVGADATQLQGHKAVVPAVDRLHDFAAAPLPEHLEQLVTLCNEACHAGIVGAGISSSCSGIGPVER